MTTTESMLDLLDHGCDGEPRCVSLDASDAQAASNLVSLLAAEAERRGYVPLAVERLAAFVRSMPEEMRHRTFALLHTHDAGTPPDRGALLTAASLNSRPHVLITIAVGRKEGPNAPVLREARSAYATGVAARPIAPSPDAERYLSRAKQAFALARSGRHEPAVRLMREAAAALARRRDAKAAAEAMLLLGRVLLERGRADDAATTFAEAVTQLDAIDPAHAAIARV